MDVLEMKCMKTLVGVSRMDRVKNQEVRWRAGTEREFASRADQRLMRSFGHVERMGEYRRTRRVLMTDASRGRVRCRPRLGWMDEWLEGGLRQQSDDCGGCATMRER